MPLIAMTREMGSLGKNVASRLAERRGGRVVYHEIIDQVADKMRVRKSHVIRLLESGANLWERLTADKTALSIFTADETYRFLRDKDLTVIRGWGAVHLLGGIAHVVRVRICAPLELRVERMLHRLGGADRAAVRREIELSDEAHSAIARRHFGLDWRDSEHYDLVLSTERLGVEDCVEEIERIAAKPGFQCTAESLQLVEDRALEWAVLAAVRRDSRTAHARVRIASASGVVRVNTFVGEDARALRDVIAGVEGVKHLDFAFVEVDSTAAARSGAEWHRAAYIRGLGSSSTR